MKKHFWKLEYSITLFVLLGFVMFFTPLRIENHFQARMIAKWNDRYDKVSYMFSVIKAQTNDEILKSFAEANSSELREKLLLQLIKPYLRLTQLEKHPRGYKPKYLDGKRVSKKDFFYFKDLYYSGKQIAGVKDISDNEKNNAWFMLMFDINGVLPPNTWGRDIYGIYIYDEGKIVPFGYDKDMDELKIDCSEEGTGISCSYYYRIGGGW
ncbi:hypothetical protein IJZ97_03460 [bacterium]|nr:hypothetical protein [bacterium]